MAAGGDYRHTITYAQTLDGVDPDCVGIWGTSLAGGHVLVVGAIDRRVGCVVAQVPTISGWQSTLRRTPAPALPGQRKAWEADRLERYTDQLDRAAAAATAWFTEHLRPEAGA